MSYCENALQLLKTSKEFNSHVTRVISSIAIIDDKNNVCYRIILEDCKLLKRGEERIFKAVTGLASAQPRGLCFVYEEEHSQDKLVTAVRGLHKFSYFEDISYLFEKNIYKNVKTLVFTEKANGENCKISGFYLRVDFFVWLISSKQVTLAVSDEYFLRDLDSTSYQSERFLMAKRIANLWFNIINTLKKNSVSNIMKFIAKHCATLIGEVLFKNKQHIVDYTPLLDADIVQHIRFFVIRDLRPESEGLAFASPLRCRKLLASWGLACVEMSCAAVDSPEKFERETDFQLATNEEGAVVYCLDSAEKVVCMYKYKSLWYVYWRFVREKMKARRSLEQLKNDIARHKSRFKGLDLESLTHDMAAFYSFCLQQEKSNKLQWSNLMDNWISLRSAFKASSSLLNAPVEDKLSVNSSTKPKKLQLVFQGLPGTGKSTLARALSHLLDLDWINQDNCGNARNYHRRISTNQNPKGLIADKCHHLAQHRVKLFRALSPTDALVLIIIQSPRDEDTLTHTAALAFERIKLRGLGHTSLIDHKTARHVIGRFARELEPFTSEELSKASLVIHLDPRLDSLSLLMQLLKELKKICREIQSFTKEEMESALKSSSEYEKNLAKRNTSLYKIVYYSLELDEESNGAIREHIPPLVKNLVTGCTFPKDFHITLLHDEDKSIPPSQKKLLEERLEREIEKGSMWEVIVSRVAYNSHVAAIILDSSQLGGLVDGPLQFVHITVALGLNPESQKRACPVESHNLRDPTKRSLITLASPLLLRGQVFRHIKHK